MVDDTTFRLSFLVASLFGVYLFASGYRRVPLLDVIPTAGFSDRILSYLSALSCQLNGVPMLEYGYKKTRSRLGQFKITTFREWIVLASDPELIKVKKPSDDILSLGARFREFFQLEYIIGLLDLNSAYHMGV
ncbi:hypothetical protein V8E53_006483 [Lactarius tabidus]